MKNILTVFLFLTVMSFNSYALETIVIVRGQDFEPYHYVDASGDETGFLVEIIRAVADSLDLKVQFKQYPWSRCLKLVKVGRVDAMMNLFKTPEREEFMYFSNNILTYEVNRFFKLKDKQINDTGDMLDLKTYKIGAIRNYSYGRKFDSIDFLHIFRLETEEDLVKSLLNRRCDIIVGNELVLKRLIRKAVGEDNMDILSPVISNDPLYIGFSKAKGHKDLSENFSRNLAWFKETGAYQDILRKYGL